jgi:MOSC domain
MSEGLKHLTTAELEAGLEEIRRSPKDCGTLELIVRRPRVDEREVLSEGELHPTEGLVGDSWKARGSSRTHDGSAHPEMQLNIMNARAVALVAQSRERWPLAGDQLYLDMDLSVENLPAGTRLSLGDALIEVTAPPHTGCKKFVSRFGLDAMKFVNSPVGRELNLRGINARVIRQGRIRVGDTAKKLAREHDATETPNTDA